VPARATRGAISDAPIPPAGAMDESRPVSEIMTRTVVKMRPEVTLREAAELMRELHVAGLPVVDDDGDLVGLLSERDLVQGLHAATGVASPRGILDLLLESTPKKGLSLFEACQRRLTTARVRDVMTTKLITIGPTSTVKEAAALMARDAIHRLPVVDEEGELVGIVTHGDVVRAIAGGVTAWPHGAMRPKPRGTSAASDGANADPYGDI
jgi:CBS domain-containing protein